MEAHVQRAYKLRLLTEDNKYVGNEPWNALLNKIDRIEKRMKSRTYITTAQLSHDKSFSSVKLPTSKVESYCLDEIHDKEEHETLTQIRDCAVRSFKRAKLSTLERELLIEMAKNPYLQFSKFARQRGLYVSYVYKVRDRAVRKLQRELEKALYAL